MHYFSDPGDTSLAGTLDLEKLSYAKPQLLHKGSSKKMDPSDVYHLEFSA